MDEWRENAPYTDIHVHLDLRAGDITFPGDEGLLALALRSLFQNAGEAMADGGHLSITVYSQGREIVIKVADTGRGIPSEKLPQIFDPFFTSRTQGSGLGLTAVQRIVSAHNGAVTVESTPGEGTEFQIQLPLYPDDMQLSELEAPAKKA